ncbi:hypothetical protein C804_06502 [Lachnospiraceae bacterium A4]|nr:hypothetical protein C804_06502 [Lachnospiraceae bacterium A4]
MKNRRNYLVNILCMVLALLVNGCGRPEVQELDFSAIEGESGSNGFEPSRQMEESEEERRQKVCNLVQEFDYTVQEYPLDTELYDVEMDQNYKKAFLALMFHKKPLPSDDASGTFFYDFPLEMRADWFLSKSSFIDAMINSAEYWYLDFDGDGLPELIFEIYGGGPKPQILKYDREKQCAYLYLMGETYNWHFLSSGKLYYYNPTSMGVLRCGVKKFDSRGNETIEIAFTNYFGCDPAECSVSYRSVENPASIVDESCHVDEAVWDELTKDLLDAIDNKIPGMTFDEVFGDMAYEYIN